MRVLGHSGQPVEDVLRYSSSCYGLPGPGLPLADIGSCAPASGAAPSELDALVNTLLWRHLAPTAPDTLTCYPFYDEDPFVLGGGEERAPPRLAFSGGARAFGSRWLDCGGGGAAGDGVRAVAVPAFWRTHTAVLVNLRSPTLEAEAITFAFGPRKPEPTPPQGGALPPGLLV